MAHRNRRFTVLKNGGFFHGYVKWPDGISKQQHRGMNAEDSTHHFDDRNPVNLTWQWLFFHDLLFIPTMVFQMPQWHKAKGIRMGKISPLRWDSSFLANQAATAAGAVALEGSEIPGEEDVTHRFSQGNTYFREWAKIVLGNTPGPLALRLYQCSSTPWPRWCRKLIRFAGVQRNTILEPKMAMENSSFFCSMIFLFKPQNFIYREFPSNVKNHWRVFFVGTWARSHRQCCRIQKQPYG